MTSSPSDKTEENGRKKAQKAQKKTKTKAEDIVPKTQDRSPNMPAWNSVFELCDIVRETGFAIHQFLRSGHVEKVYENALVHRLRKQGVQVLQQHPLAVHDEDGTVLGEFFADLFIENILIVELNAVRHVVDEHVAQLLGYLRCSRVEHGLLVNFGAPHFYIKKYILSDAFA